MSVLATLPIFRLSFRDFHAQGDDNLCALTTCIERSSFFAIFLDGIFLLLRSLHYSVKLTKREDVSYEFRYRGRPDGIGHFRFLRDFIFLVQQQKLIVLYVI